MIGVAAAIVSAWAILLGTGYVARYRLGAGLSLTLAALAICFAALCAVTVAMIGRRGPLAAAGLLVPFAVSAVLVARKR